MQKARRTVSVGGVAAVRLALFDGRLDLNHDWRIVTCVLPASGTTSVVRLP